MTSMKHTTHKKPIRLITFLNSGKPKHDLWEFYRVTSYLSQTEQKAIDITGSHINFTLHYKQNK